MYISSISSTLRTPLKEENAPYAPHNTTTKSPLDIAPGEKQRPLSDIAIGAKGILREVFHKASRSADKVKDQSTAAARGSPPDPKSGVRTDIGGHILGHRFTKDQGIKNMFPQNAHFNNSAYKKMENEWADWIEKKGGSVEVSIKLLGDGTRPDKVQVEYFLIDAKGKIMDEIRKNFVNDAGQIFIRQYF